MKIIGIGNPFAGDDGIGIELLHRLSGVLPASCEFYEASHSGLELLEVLDDKVPIVFLDAVADESPLGTVHGLEWDERADWISEKHLPSSHGFSVLEVLRLAQTLGQKLPPIHFIGVSIKSSSPSEHLSMEMIRQLPTIVNKSRHYIYRCWRGGLPGSLF